MQAHGKLLQIKALFASLASSGRLSQQLLESTAAVASKATDADCPALVAERLEIGRLLLSHPAAGFSEAAAPAVLPAAGKILAGGRHNCGSGAVGELKGAAMWPVLVQTAVAALLEGGSNGDGLLHVLLESPDRDVRLASLRALLHAPGTGECLCLTHSRLNCQALAQSNGQQFQQKLQHGNLVVLQSICCDPCFLNTRLEDYNESKWLANGCSIAVRATVRCPSTADLRQ